MVKKLQGKRRSPPRLSSRKGSPRRTPSSPRASELQHGGAPALRDDPFPVVAVGASAGGLEAMTELLRHLPAEPGSAIILLQHLHAERESLLAEILQKATRLPVRRITAGMPLERNAVFVAPASHDIRLDDRVFYLDPKPATRGREMPIDRLFESVAEQFDTSAVGVVLSGTLSDGALGLRAIKDAGGVTFAQDPSTATFSEMPRAAVVAGGVDRVLPPERIAREIVRLAKHPYLSAKRDVSAEAVPLPNEEDLSAGRRLFHILRSATGVDFSAYRQSTFRRRIHRRMALRRIPTLAKYVEFLRANPQEVDTLFDDILITVTRFFRDPEVFEVLRRSVFPQLIQNRPKNAPIRFWVPGCSTGEEVYSLAIALFETVQDLSASPNIQIFATDINDTALQRARAGEYLENSMVDVSDERRKTFFTRTSAGWQISKMVRDACVFARQNVAADPPFSSIDFLSCRNLLIYLDPTLQQRIFPLFHYSLKPGGFLLLGRSESIGTFADLFESVDRGHRIFMRKATVPRTIGDFGRPPALERPAEGVRQSAGGSGARLHQQADRLVLGRYGPPGVLVNAEFDVVEFRGRTSHYLEPAAGSASLNVLKMAREGLLPDLRAALMRAKKTGRRVRREGLRFRVNGAFVDVHLEVVPLTEAGSDQVCYLILFEPPAGTAAVRRLPPPSAPAGKQRGGVPSGRRARDTVTALERELQSTKEYLQAIIEEQEASNEELKSANEEILSANEELQSTNEELETAKEELQSTNEELTTVNEELQNRNTELAFAHNDLANVFGINLPIVMIGSSGSVRRFTEPAERLFNLGPNDVGRRFSEFRARLKNIDINDMVEHVLETAQPVEREVQDEVGNWYSLRIKPYRTIENRIDGAIVALFDLRTTEQITRSLDYAEALVETVRESLLVLDPELRVISANRSFYRQFRSAPSRTEGRPLDELWELGRRAPELLYLLESVVAERDPVMNHEVEIDFEGAGRRALNINARRVQPTGQEKPVVLLAIEDITDRKWAEAGLRASELRYRLLFETAREGIWLLDGETGRVIDVNPYLVELLRARKEDIVGKVPWTQGFYADAAAAHARFDELLARGFSYDSDIGMRARTGEALEIEAVSNVYSVGSSRIVQCNMRDLTERSKLQSQVRQMQKLDSIGTLAGGIAHDFNNILNIISAHLALVQRGDGGGQKKQSAAAIEQAVRRGAGVVKQLLTFAQRSSASFEPTDVNAIVEEVLGMVRETFPKTIHLERDLAKDLPGIVADPNQIHQALLNLLVNARDAMPSGGTVRVQTARVPGETLRDRLENADSDEYVKIEVRDQGPGMSEDVRKHLFEPFFTTKEKGKGIGMGLAVVYGVVQSHQGSIDVESEPGNGTCFALYFPVTESAGRDTPVGDRQAGAEPQSAEAGSMAKDGNGNGTGKTILFVEDEELLRGAIRSLLEEQGYRVLIARDGLEAVQVHGDNRSEIDAVIVDLGLPKLDGWEAYLRMKKANPDLKAIIASGNLDAEKRARMRREGIQATLRKPYGAGEIMKALRKVLEA